LAKAELKHKVHTLAADAIRLATVASATAATTMNAAPIAAAAAVATANGPGPTGVLCSIDSLD